jgi:hypothetical protein
MMVENITTIYQNIVSVFVIDSAIHEKGGIKIVSDPLFMQGHRVFRAVFHILLFYRATN